MDLRTYFSRIREVEANITGADAVVVSLDTPDGGRAGVVNEVPRHAAAKMVADGRARLATPEEADAYRAHVAEEFKKSETARALARPQFAVLSEAELKVLRSAVKNSK